MKIRSLLLYLVFLPGFLLAQETPSETPLEETPKFNNEIKLNMLELLIMPALGVNFEHFLNSSSSFGVYGFVNFGWDEGYRYEKIEVAPYYRIYFQRQNKLDNKGLFTEVFAGLNLGETEYFEYTDEFNYQMGNLYLEEYFGIALGVAVGYKFINFNNYSFEVFAGAGRFLNNQRIQAYPRVGLSIGKRF